MLDARCEAQTLSWTSAIIRSDEVTALWSSYTHTFSYTHTLSYTHSLITGWFQWLSCSTVTLVCTLTKRTMVFPYSWHSLNSLETNIIQRRWPADAGYLSPQIQTHTQDTHEDEDEDDEGIRGLTRVKADRSVTRWPACESLVFWWTFESAHS